MIARYEREKVDGRDGVSVSVYSSLINLPHWNAEHELIYIASGSAELMAGDSCYLLEAGACAFVGGGEVHCIRSEQDSIVWVLKAAPDSISSVTAGRQLVCHVTEHDYGVAERLAEIYEELESGKQYGSIIAACITLKLAAEIFRGEKTAAVSVDKGRVSDRFKALLGRMNEEYAAITFDEAAAFMCLSRPYFSKYFHRAAGMTFTRYLNIVKVSAACEMISEGKLCMTEIAMKCGFGTIRSFNRLFKELTGSSPSELPDNYRFVRTPDSGRSFDPTLSCTKQLNTREVRIFLNGGC